MSLLECKNVAFSYEGHEVLSEINFSIHRGDYLCIVGENGAGKSTLIKGMLNLKKPSSGRIMAGEGLCQNEIGYLPQQTQVQKDFPASVYEVVLSGTLNHGKNRILYARENKKQVQNNLERLGILALKNRCYRDLSGGQQQRVLLARALCATGKMILLDEPITGLDPIAAQELYDMIWKLNQEDGITVIMVSHDVKGIIGYASHILHLGRKQLFFGSVEEYRNTELGKRFLLGSNPDFMEISDK